MSWLPTFGGYGGAGAAGGAPPTGNTDKTSGDGKDKGKGSIRGRRILQMLQGLGSGLMVHVTARGR